MARYKFYIVLYCIVKSIKPEWLQSDHEGRLNRYFKRRCGMQIIIVSVSHALMSYSNQIKSGLFQAT